MSRPQRCQVDPTASEAAWSVYLLRCGDGTLYCGIAKDVEARLAQHREGKGARYTKGRGPLEVVYREACLSQSEALKREMGIKRMGREEKLTLTTEAADDADPADEKQKSASSA